MSEVNAEKLAAVYVKIRKAREELSKKDKELEEQQKLVSEELLKICKEQGAQTIRTTHGTISRRTNKHFWTSDWDAFFRFIKENDSFALLQRRINNSNMEQFLEENPEARPPGLQADINQTVVIVKR